LDGLTQMSGVTDKIFSLNPAGVEAARLRAVWSHTDRSLQGCKRGPGSSLRLPRRGYLGGVEDHVHLVARFGRSITQADWVKELKRVSSLWLKERSADLALFAWQNGYAAFSVSHSRLESVLRYIQEQEQHHLKMTFQDELRALLRKHEVQWDERYLWD